MLLFLLGLRVKGKHLWKGRAWAAIFEKVKSSEGTVKH